MTEQPILLTEHEHLVAHQAAGAVVGFAGVVRDHDGGREVVRLSTPPTRTPSRFSSRCSPKWRRRPRRPEPSPPATVGTLAIGEAALAVAVAADHRAAAFQTCARIVEIVGRTAPGLEAPVLRRRNRRVGELHPAFGRSCRGPGARVTASPGTGPCERALGQGDQKIVAVDLLILQGTPGSFRWETFGLDAGPIGSSLVPGGRLSGLGRCGTPICSAATTVVSPVAGEVVDALRPR